MGKEGGGGGGVEKRWAAHDGLKMVLMVWDVGREYCILSGRRRQIAS